MKTKLLTLLVLPLLCTCARAQSSNVVALADESLVTPDGLYFDGERGVDYQFGRQISAHGDCIEVIGGFVFVTWYQGGMDNRLLRLSRRRLGDPAAPWVTLEFPDQHIGYRGDPTMGDSPNTIAVGVSTIDSTVHLLYDMHAYSQSGVPNNFFNYRVMNRDGAVVRKIILHRC
ncbi:hypothetical protein [Neolewinella persica]|uniref:hypothetical protein n=1 Tax=Neolewinella persica TaxID=70998 RepID=UPI0003A3B30A|nr:hypothetical protein [Neolewinella persica]